MRKEKRIILLVFLAALAIRLIYVFMYSHYIIPDKDSLFYDKMATSILNGYGLIDQKGNPTSGIPPVYPIFLSTIYFIFGHSYLAARIIQAILSSFVCVFIYYIGKTIFGQKEGILAAVISVIFPSFIFFSYYGGPCFLITENLVIFILTLLVFYVSRIKDLTLFNGVVIGTITGILLLTKFNFIFLPVICILYFLWIARHYKKSLMKFLGAYCISLLLVMSPWTIRNYMISNRVSVLLNDEMTSSLVMFAEMFPRLETKWSIDTLDLSIAVYRGEAHSYLSGKWGVDKKNVDSEIKRRIFYELSHHTREYINPKLLFKNLKIFWSPYYNPYANPAKKINFAYMILMPFSLWGVVISLIRKNKKAIFPLSVIAGLSFIHLFTILCERYRYPIEPILIVFASFGFLALLDIFYNRNIDTGD